MGHAPPLTPRQWQTQAIQLATGIENVAVELGHVRALYDLLQRQQAGLLKEQTKVTVASRCLRELLARLNNGRPFAFKVGRKTGAKILVTRVWEGLVETYRVEVSEEERSVVR